MLEQKKSMHTTLTSIQAGKPQWFGVENAVDPLDRLWYSGMLKEKVQGSVWVGKTNIDGDGQADLENHGGVDKAVLAYAECHYEYFSKKLKCQNIPFGSFGENITVHSWSEKDICIGDTFEIGGTIIQVSQPRQPCWKLSRHFKVKDLALIIQITGRTGWYYRVLQEGYIEQGQTIKLIERPYPQWTVAICNEIMHHDKNNRERTSKLVDCPLLAQSWVSTLTTRLNNENTSTALAKRLIGPNEE